MSKETKQPDPQMPADLELIGIKRPQKPTIPLTPKDLILLGIKTPQNPTESTEQPTPTKPASNGLELIS